MISKACTCVISFQGESAAPLMGSEGASYQDGAPGRRLQAGQAASQHGSVAALRIVLQGNAVWLGVLHNQARIVGMRQTGVQVAPWRIHKAGPKPEVECALVL